MIDPADAARTIGEALHHGIRGDQDRGLDLLQPLVDDGPHTTYAVLGGLAEVASFTALRAQQPGTVFALPVEDTATGQPVSADVLPPPLRFASRFVTAWANRDQDTAHALFDAFAGEADRTGSPDLGQAITLVYQMAVTTGTDVVRQARAARGDTS